MDAELTKQVKDLVFHHGGDVCGIADLTTAKEYIKTNFDPNLSKFDRAVSVGVFFPASVINELTEGPTHTYLHYYRVVNVLIDDIALKVSTFLHKKGYDNFPIPSSQRVSKDKLAGIFSHRIAASLSGIGWIGKNSCLINPEVGPRLRIITVLTNAPLVPDQPIESRCGNCTACTEVCPPGAIQGVAFKNDQPIEERLLADKCDEYQNQIRGSFGKRVCGKCLAVCPWGKLKSGSKGEV